MFTNLNELEEIIRKFACSGYDVIEGPAQKWLDSVNNYLKFKPATRELLAALQKADQECGSCGCEFDDLYKKAIELLKIVP